MEITIIKAIEGIYTGLADNVWYVFKYLQSKFVASNITDPANTNNIVSDDIILMEKINISIAARKALAAKNWNHIIR